MAVLAHPDDESLGFGGTLAKYAAEGVETFLRDRHTRRRRPLPRSSRPATRSIPGQSALGEIREAELRAAAAVLGVREVSLLDYRDQQLDRAEPQRGDRRIVAHLRRVRPDVVVTFGPDGAYGHPDHIAISQFTTAAIVAAADRVRRAAEDGRCRTRCRSCTTWPGRHRRGRRTRRRSKKLVSTVDGVERQAVPWPDWAITTVIDTRDLWSTVWRAVSCHESQMPPTSD